MSRADTPKWLADPDEGLPQPGDLSRTVTLHTCCACGRRAANPLTGNWSCLCGGETVYHEFGPTAYSELRVYGEVRTNV